MNLPRVEIPASWNTLTEKIIGAAFEVHSTLGCGLLERLYEDAMAHELTRSQLRFDRQRVIRVPYKDTTLSELRLDLIVEDLVIVELKCIERVIDVHSAQLVSYLRSTDLPLGLIFNFHHPHLRDGLTRRVNPKSSRFGIFASNPSLPSMSSAFNTDLSS